MSKHCWEHGTIVLPSAAVAGVRAELRVAANAAHAQVLDLARWYYTTAVARTRSSKKFTAGYDLVYREAERRRMPHELAEQVYFVLESLASAPRMPRSADVETHVPTVNTRTTVFTCGEATIAFQGRNVTWHVPENNHAVDAAHAHPVARAFFTALGRVTWARGTGGDLVGNDEYNTESYDDGAGSNYVTASYGPKTTRRDGGASSPPAAAGNHLADEPSFGTAHRHVRAQLRRSRNLCVVADGEVGEGSGDVGGNETLLTAAAQRAGGDRSAAVGALVTRGRAKTAHRCDGPERIR